MINNKIFNAAREISKRSNMKYRIGTVIFDNDKNVLARGNNFFHGESLTARISNRYLHAGRARWSIHSEAAAVIRYYKKYNSYPHRLNMYVFRGNRIGEPRLAKPCPLCSKLIESLEMNVEYSK